MLVRADPNLKAVSMLSFPRDLVVDVTCPDKPSYRGRINEAFTVCGTKGTLETVRKLTGLPVHYLVTVNFRGFRQLVDAVGGVWVDIDRRYFNDRGGPYGYATINLQPGYQKLGGYQALDYVRYRHTDSDLYRVARQQLFLRAFKQQVRAQFTPLKIPNLVKTIANNTEVAAGGGKTIDFSTLVSYALFAYELPPGHFFQARIGGLEGYAELTTAAENITQAVQEFSHPDVESPEKATLNGNGVAGSASTAGYLLNQRGYPILTPPNGAPANAPSFDYFETKVYFQPGEQPSRLAAQRVANLFGSADVESLPTDVAQLGNGAVVTVIVGQTFHGTLAPAPVDKTPEKQPANVAPGADASVAYLEERQGRIPFPLLVPTVIERNSWIDREKPVRMYRVGDDRKHKTVRLTYRTGGGEYWGVQMTDWEDAPVLSERNFVRNIGGRRYELHYIGPKLHMVVLRTEEATYWVVNTVLDTLSNETMLAIAKGLRPLGKVR
jgi:LCP family protein required for cell wall assembly